MENNQNKIWYWNDTPYSLEQIQQGNYVPQDDAMQTAWAFVQQWLNGETLFTLPTSGSTGKPKLITLTRAQMIASAKGTAQALHLETHTSALLAINPQYIGGKMMLVRALEYNLTLIGIPPVSNPFTQASLKQNYDFIAFVPAQLYTIATQTPQLLPYLNSSKAIILGGGAVGELLLSAIQTIEAPIYNTYGMTETVSHIALKRLNGAEKTTYFLACEGVQLAIDERDCLQIRAEVTKNEWIQTNDIVELIDDKRFIWVGRADNILNTGGIKVQIEALETQIARILTDLHLPISFAIIGVPDAQWQEKIVLYFETLALPADTIEAVWKALKAQLKRYEVPKEIRCLTQFPRTETGKLQRKIFF